MTDMNNEKTEVGMEEMNEAVGGKEVVGPRMMLPHEDQLARMRNKILTSKGHGASKGDAYRVCYNAFFISPMYDITLGEIRDMLTDIYGY